MELDSVVHQANWERLDDEHLKENLNHFMRENSSWAIDGNYQCVQEMIWEQASHIVWLDLPLWKTSWRLLNRSIRRILRREELWNGNHEHLGSLFSPVPENNVILWSWSMHKKYQKKYSQIALHKKWSAINVAVLKNSHDIDEWLEQLSPLRLT